MDISAKIFRQILLFTLILLIIPMVLFPERLGTNLLRGALHYVLLEFAFYGFVLYFFDRQTSLLKLSQNAGVCVAYRLLVGAILGCFITIAYNMNIVVAMTLGMSSYVPAIVLHMAATPFILSTILFNKTKKIKSQSTPSQSYQTPKKKEMKPSGFTASKPITPKKQESDTFAEQSFNFSSRKLRAQQGQSAKTNENGFQNAINYIGENGSVQMAALVDAEGLLMAGFNRGQYEPEDIAPFALPIVEKNADTYKRLKLTIPEKTDLMFEDKRMIIASEQYYTLIVISERTMDDVLNIRINQGLEMIRMYTAERYSEKLIGNAERIYV
ncbi:MAG: hypothetical protein DWP97_14580 [Calditrichaeota bacterium]|nr:MAG: hypothetical protein DWP97_14580 [Calditrichota bacterium]